jgi:alkylation response protein AidB-like acyl-CoA dehydrogenase
VSTGINQICFAISEDQQIACSEIEQFARDNLQLKGPDCREFPWDNWRLCAEQGLTGLLVSEEYGGAGFDCTSAVLVLEALGKGAEDHGLVHAICTQIISAKMIEQFASEEQKQEILPKVCTGEIMLAQAITEPDAGSDTSALRTKAVENGADYLLSGSKLFTTNGPIADLVIVFAVTNEKAMSSLGRLSCFLVDKDTPGFTRSEPVRKMGLHTLQNGELYFDECRLNADRIMGSKGAGSAIFSEGIIWERILLFATHVGKIASLLCAGIDYAKERKQFGKPIGSYQAVSHKIADARVSLELSQLIIRKAAWLKDQGSSGAVEAAIAKLFVSESCRQVALDTVQIHGGNGYMEEYGVERELRDAIAGTIYSGTSEIQRNIIARLCGL